MQNNYGNVKHHNSSSNSYYNTRALAAPAFYLLKVRIGATDNCHQFNNNVQVRLGRNEPWESLLSIS